MTGTVKNINLDKGFGFIQGEDGNEYFFHRSAIVNGEMKDMARGRQVTFEPGEGPKGPRAEDVTL